ncbi:uncharacterized protein [Temnothorax nylanderi]|uniref:uncharacterized protein n=1 Tax=Temnothorax nylanderi TaxID=102681 RepID=UPI003A896144
MIESKLDATTLRGWEQNANTVDATLTDFLEKRCQTLERIEVMSKDKEVTRRAESDKQKTKAHGHEKTTAALANTTEAGKCYLCHGDHLMYRCEKFLALSVDDRLNEIRRLKLCTNCLRNDHFVRTCKMGSCRECSRRHNTLCHRPAADQVPQGEKNKNEQTIQASDDKDKMSSNVVVHHVMNGPAGKHVLMATVLINAAHPNGSIVPLRILLDSASEAHFITHSACNRLGMKRDRTSEIITGLSGTESVVSQCCEVIIRSRYSNVTANVRSFIVPKITKMLPSVDIDYKEFKIPSNIKLADPEFHKQGSIDMLIGAEFFFDWLETGKIELGSNYPVLQNTRFGWIVAGTFPRAPIASLTCHRDAITTLTCSLEHCETLNQNMSRFWELENYGSNAISLRSGEARESDEFFDKTTTRTDEGRFIVRLPFVENPKTLGESREIAYKRLMQLERRFKNDEILHDRYVEFMRDYLATGHMSPVTESNQDYELRVVYLPHHGVIKEESTSTKLRVVFDASNKTSSGKSLNDILRVGPTKQCSLVVIVSRFRFFLVAITGDIRQMYRQMLVHPDDRDCQRINIHNWRFTPDEPVQEFRLNTVTYGKASSPYLAVNCTFKLAEEAKRKYPMAALMLFKQTYMDNTLKGANSVEEAALLQEQLTEILRSGGFETHKWCSSRAEALEKVPPHLREDTHNVNIDANDTINMLGIK